MLPFSHFLKLEEWRAIDVAFPKRTSRCAHTFPASLTTAAYHAPPRHIATIKRLSKTGPFIKLEEDLKRAIRAAWPALYADKPPADELVIHATQHVCTSLAEPTLSLIDH